jgi:hypothetical protein
MDVTLAILADAANVSQEGKLNILGAFANINASRFPTRHPEMHLVLRFEASAAEAGMKKAIEVKALDEDGQQVGELTAELQLPSAPQSGRRIRVQTILRITDAVFPKPGDYVFAVLVDGKTESEVALQLTLTKGKDDDAS